MKAIKILLMSLFVMTLGLSLSSCTPEDNSSTESVIIGTWIDRAYSYNSYDEYTFRGDKTFREVFYSGEIGETYVFDGQYSLVNDVLTLHFYEDDILYDIEAYEVEVIDNDRISLNGIMYVRK